MGSNSDSKSRRSFNSILPNPCSSNHSTDGNKSSKKRKTTQKTLGMAWGANSRSSSDSLFCNSPFSDFGSYMAVKNQKLHQQFNAAASSSSNSGPSCANPIFTGVSIFVDGYTVPSNQELRSYMLKYGGRFENYFSRHLVTHIICSNLPDSKIKNLRGFSGGLPVVKPAWVLDSVAANKLLSWVPYQLDQLAVGSDNQPKLAAFFTPKNSGGSEIVYQCVDGPSFPKLNSGQSKDCAAVEQTGNCTAEPGDLLQISINKVMADEPASSIESSCEGNSGKLSDCPPLDGQATDESGSCHASTSRISLPSKRCHSTLTDPNFVENYFRNSRLHFIGTWRTRYRKRFPSLSRGFNCRNSHLNTDRVNKTAIIHIDMDCFFVSVIIRKHPELLGKPVAVCHSDNPRGTSEISSANYPARDHGVKAGMFVKEAKLRCPQLVIVPYDFEAYEKVADQFYDILHKHCSKVQAVSCDEAFLDISESEEGDPQLLASTIRKEIFEATGCTASAGIAGNMLLACLATKTAKPDGQFQIHPEKVESYLCTLPVKMLPGIGHVLEAKLKEKKIKTCGQLQLITKESLQKDFGKKTGEMLWNYSRGIDNRLVGVIQESKSIGAEVNWGVRFMNSDDTQHFLMKLCKEVSLRLQGCGVQGRSFTLKIKKKRSDAGEPVKYMGCGDCQNLSHTITIPMATDDADVLHRLATQLFAHFHVDVEDIRGMGLQASKLEGADDNKIGCKGNSILSWLVSGSAKVNANNEIGLSNTSKPCNLDALSDNQRLSHGKVSWQPHSNITGSSIRTDSSLSHSETGVSKNANLPCLPDLDMTVIDALPPEVVSEINQMYGGMLYEFISENKSKTERTEMVFTATSKGFTVQETERSPAHIVQSNKLRTNEHGDEANVVHDAASSCPRNLMPSSLSQVDCLVLQQLPDELKKDIIKLLPQHREAEFVRDVSATGIDKQIDSEASTSNKLWIGSPPMWVEKFRISTCKVLNRCAMIYESGSCSCLSSLLQRLMSRTLITIEGADGYNVAVSWLCDLIKQYIDLKIATNIEEVSCCICLLKRLTLKSNIFLEVYNIILPHVQASVGEKYGGTLCIPFVST
ncbi:DNA repair protein REV1 isoform X2 [Andrographis paniculata]|uniref:DNA repair protein REV1 isoform X2 n=1 Tax=Andrographis paniculata TaxID=175694 RepID=UPI0021E83E04|nr:DNA repair protein REV1 isoform X2 [Andrographis paniculata]